MTNFSLDTIRYEIVTLAIDDFHGLYEIVWRLNSLFPEIPIAIKLSHCKLAMADLIQEDIINLIRINWCSQAIRNIGKEEAISDLANDDRWCEPTVIDVDYVGFHSKGDQTLKEERRLYLKINNF